jgi:hypothetical protein
MASARHRLEGINSASVDGISWASGSKESARQQKDRTGQDRTGQDMMWLKIPRMRLAEGIFKQVSAESIFKKAPAEGIFKKALVRRHWQQTACKRFNVIENVWDRNTFEKIIYKILERLLSLCHRWCGPCE